MVYEVFFYDATGYRESVLKFTSYDEAVTAAVDARHPHAVEVWLDATLVRYVAPTPCAIDACAPFRVPLRRAA